MVVYSAHQQVQYTSRYLKSGITKCFKKILETKRYKRLYKSKIKQLLQKKMFGLHISLKIINDMDSCTKSINIFFKSHFKL